MRRAKMSIVSVVQWSLDSYVKFILDFRSAVCVTDHEVLVQLSGKSPSDILSTSISNNNNNNNNNNNRTED